MWVTGGGRVPNRPAHCLGRGRVLCSNSSQGGSPVRRSLVLLAVLSLAFAPLPFPRPGKGGKAASDLKALQGEWVQVSCSLNGGPPAASGGEDTAVYDGARLTRLSKGVASARWVV